MKKILFLVVVLVVIFFFRGQLPGYFHEYFTAKQDDPIEWFYQQRDTLYADLPDFDFTLAIKSLNNFESTIQKNMLELSKSDLIDDQKRSFHRNMICELVVVYRKMAMQYLNHGEDDFYIEYIRKSQDKLAECSNLKE